MNQVLVRTRNATRLIGALLQQVRNVRRLQLEAGLWVNVLSFLSCLLDSELMLLRKSRRRKLGSGCRECLCCALGPSGLVHTGYVLLTRKCRDTMQGSQTMRRK